MAKTILMKNTLTLPTVLLLAPLAVLPNLPAP
jgi:hypothetical protein